MAVGILSPGGAPISGESPGRADRGAQAGGASQGVSPRDEEGTQREAQSLLFLRLLLVHPVLTLLP